VAAAVCQKLVEMADVWVQIVGCGRAISMP
jgi:hypothetical protein